MSVATNARQITPEEAHSIACEFFNSNFSKGINSQRRVVRSSISPTPEKLSEEQAYYVFNAGDNGGFVIISGDDRVPKILGYSDKGSFDILNMPSSLKWYFEKYEKYLRRMLDFSSQDPSWQVSSYIADGGLCLETASWGQGFPYNSKCPVIDGIQAPTGCVATAMATVMRYHCWPKNYNWDIMPTKNVDESNSSEIAALMSELGASVQMEYGKEESMGYTGLVSQSLYTQYGYSYTVQAVALGGNDHISHSQWIELLKDEINSNRPIIYIGTGSSSHAFVLDGYNESELYHINWGWDGAYNGYYSLDALMPYEGADFSGSEGMVFRIQPKSETDPQYSETAFIDYGYLVGINCFHGLGLNPDVNEIKENEEFHMTFATLNVLPKTWFGVALVDEKGTIKEVLYEEYCSYEYSDDNTGFIHYLGEAKATPHVKIEETDRIQLIAKGRENDLWLPVRGTLETPSSKSVSGIESKLSHIKWTVPDDIEIKHHHCNTTYNGIIKEIARGSLLDIYAYAKEDGIVEIDINGFNNYSDLTSWESDRIGSCAEVYCLADSINIDVRFIPDTQLEALDIENTTPGKLEEKISDTTELRMIKSLRITGKLDTRDFDFIRSNFKNLSEIDLSGSIIEEYGDCQANNLPVNALQGLPLKNITLPDNLEVIRAASLGNMYRLYDLEIPASVNRIDGDAMIGCWNLRRIVFKNPEPFEGSEISLPSWFSSIGFIVVPIGSSDRYRKASYSNCFSRILEGDLIPAESIGIEHLEEGDEINAFYCWGPEYKISIIPDNSTDYIICRSQNKDIATVDYHINEYGIYAQIVGRSIENLKSEITISGSSGASCSVMANSLGQVKSFSIDRHDVELTLNEKFSLKYDIDPIDYPVSWLSSDPEVASVTEYGEVTAHSIGKAVITATVMYDITEHKDLCNIIVSSIVAEKILLSDSEIKGMPGDVYHLTATVIPDNTTNKAILWSSDNTNVAEVDEYGNLKLIGYGEATITAAAMDKPDVFAECKVLVDDLSGIEVISSDVEVKIFSTTGILLFEGKYADAMLEEGIYIVVTSDNQIKKLVK